MQIFILTISPEMFSGPFSCGLFQKAVDKGVVKVDIRNIRDYTHDKHHTTDDYPLRRRRWHGDETGAYFRSGGNDQSRTGKKRNHHVPVILMTPQGQVLTQSVAQKLSQYKNMIMICGQYEGVDERVREHLITEEISIGDYVLSGGELAAMVVVNTIVRLLPGFLGSPESLISESHTDGLLEYPQYTRPPEFRNWAVPEVLLSGNHAQIAKWRKNQSIIRTKQRRPDMIERASK